MKVTYFSCFIVCCLFLLSCDGKPTRGGKSLDDCSVVAVRQLINGDEVVTCDIGSVKDTLTIPLSQLIEDFQIIKLENREEAIVKAEMNSYVPMSFSENYMGMYDFSRSPYRLFDKEGNFICAIGSIGQGPNEYRNIYDDFIDEENNRVYLLPWSDNKILVFDLQGNPYPYIPLSDFVPKGKFSIDNKAGTVTVGILPFDEDEVDKAVWVQDMQGNVIQKVGAKPYSVWPDYSNEIYGWKNSERFDYFIARWVGEPDSLYWYNPAENRLVPTFTVRFKGEDVPQHSYAELPGYYFADVVSEIRAGQSQPPANILIDKKSLKGAYFNLVNDYLGGSLITWPIIRFKNGRFFMNMDPGDLEEDLKNALKREHRLQPDVVERIKSLLKTLSSNDNNYLLTGQIKGNTGNITSTAPIPTEENKREEPPAAKSENEIAPSEADSIYAMPFNTAHLPNALKYFRANNKYKDWDKDKKVRVFVNAISRKDSTVTNVEIATYQEWDASSGEWVNNNDKRNNELAREAVRLIEAATILPGCDEKRNLVNSKFVIVVEFPPR